MGSPADPQRLLSFANFTSAVLDAQQRPAPVVLPGISHLLGGPKPRPVDATGRQRVNELGDFVERRRSSPISAPSTPTAAEEDDDEAEDKTPWPSANQYYDIFTNMDGAKIPVYDLGLDPRGVPLHPEFIYSQPVSCMYFLKCAQLLGKGSFGFPRKKKASEATGKKNSNGGANGNAKGKKESSKDFEWRKMSFVTGLPKKQPIVRYITATCYSRATDLSAKKKVFRMHAVMLADATGSGEMGEYVLVHIRAGGSKRVGLRASVSDSEAQAIPMSPLSCNNDDDNSSTKRPVSPPMASVPSYNSQAASTSPRNKKLLHADFSSSNYTMSSSHAFGKFLMPPSPPQAQQQSTGNFERIQTPSPMMRHPMLMNATPAYDATKFNNARQVMRDMIFQSCSSRDEMAKYVHCLQEELAALQQQTSPGSNTSN